MTLTSCSVADCPDSVKGRGLCNKHLIRLRTHGNVSAYHSDARYKQDCETEGCTGKIHARGACQKHYDQERFGRAATCSVADCQQPVKGAGLCNKHLLRLRRHGDVNARRARETWPSGPTHPSWTDNPSYETVHLRLGIAKLATCAHCPDQAKDWAYDHTDPDEKTSSKGFRYSTDLSRYFPLCRTCHVRFDRVNG